jgi:hypothetical protein
MIPITGFNPGNDPGNQGVITDCTNLVPSTNGLTSAGDGLDAGLPAISGTFLEASSQVLLDGSARLFAGTLNKLYELSAGSWVDRSVGGGYSTSTNNTWRFAQFGDATIATNYNDAMQVSTSGAFSNLAGTPPKAKIIDTAAGFVMAFNYNDGVNIFSDGWWCSGLYNHTTWTPSPSTQAANGRLFDTPGPITAGKHLGSAMVAYKNNSMYLGQYIGPPVIWSWQQISNDIGAFSQEAVVSTESKHYFIGDNGIYVFDGARPVPIGTIEVKHWLKSVINQTYKAKCKATFDRVNSLIYFFYPSQESTGELDEALVYNTLVNQFGRVSKNIKSLLSYSSPNLTWLQLGSLYSTWGGWPSTILWVDPSFFGAEVGSAYIDNNQKLGIFNVGGYSASSSMVTGDNGDDTYFSTISRVRPRFLKSPLSATMTHYWKNGEGEPLNTGATVTMSDFKFDLLKSARLHRLKLTFNGAVVVTGYELLAKQSGNR